MCPCAAVCVSNVTDVAVNAIVIAGSTADIATIAAIAVAFIGAAAFIGVIVGFNAGCAGGAGFVAIKAADAANATFRRIVGTVFTIITAVIAAGDAEHVADITKSGRGRSWMCN